MLLNDFLQDWMNRGSPDRVDLAPGEKPLAPFTPNPEPLPGIIGNLTDYGRLADAFRANNNLISSATEWIGFTNALAAIPEDPNFDVFRDYDMRGMEKFAYQFGWAKSRAQADEVRKRLVEDMAVRQRFSELDPITQFVVGAIASTGPVDVIPFGLGRGIVAGGLIAGAAIGGQSLLRTSMALQPGDWRDAAFDAAAGALFTGGFNAARRLISPEHGPRLDAYRDARAAEVPPTPESFSAGPPRAEPVAPMRQADAEPAPFVLHDRDATVRPGPDGPVEMPRGDGYRAPFFVSEEGERLGGKPDFTDHRSVPSSRPLSFKDPVLSDGAQIYDMPRIITDDAPPTVVGKDVMQRPFIIVEDGGRSVMADVPSAAEIVQGRLSGEPFERRGVIVTEKPEIPGEAKPAADPNAPNEGRPVIIVEDSSVGARQVGNVWRDQDSAMASAGGLEKLRLTPAAFAARKACSRSVC